MKLKTIDYIHKSNPEKKTIVPEDFGKKASGLVKFVLETEGSVPLFYKVKEFPILLNEKVLNDMADLAKLRLKPETPEALKLQDSIYLGVCKLCANGIVTTNNYYRYGLGIMLNYLNNEIEDL